MPNREVDRRHMQRALRMAMRGQGLVEPNPMVGCVIAIKDEVIAEGWHEEFGDHHAEVNAIHASHGRDLSEATMYVTLEPCSHQGKTPPCVEAIARCGVRRVVIGQVDPFPAVHGSGIDQLRSAGIQVEVGLLETEAQELNAPYLKRVRTGRPWVLAKWAMTLDGKIATRTGNSQWITNSESRAKSHRLRGRMDAIIVGRQTVFADDPALTARPPGPRIATRIVVDSRARTPTNCELVSTATEIPTIVAVGPDADPADCAAFAKAGCQIIPCAAPAPNDRLGELLDELGSRGMTNVLIEGGGKLTGSFLDQRLVDEVHVFIAPKIIGGIDAIGATGGDGVATIAEAWQLQLPSVEILNDNLYISGRLK